MRHELRQSAGHGLQAEPGEGRAGSQESRDDAERYWIAAAICRDDGF